MDCIKYLKDVYLYNNWDKKGSGVNNDKMRNRFKLKSLTKNKYRIVKIYL